jgi:hypothetical protein
VLAGNVERGTAAVASQILNVYLRAVSVGLEVRDQEEVADGFERFEAALEKRRNGGYGRGA